MPIYANGRDTSLRVYGASPGAGDIGSKTLSMVSPSVGAQSPCFYTENGITVSRLVGMLRGSNNPSVAWTVRFGATHDGPSKEVIDGGSVTDDPSAGSSDVLFTNSKIPANQIVCLEVTAVGGTVDEFHVTLIPTL